MAEVWYTYASHCLSACTPLLNGMCIHCVALCCRYLRTDMGEQFCLHDQITRFHSMKQILLMVITLYQYVHILPSTHTCLYCSCPDLGYTPLVLSQQKKLKTIRASLLTNFLHSWFCLKDGRHLTWKAHNKVSCLVSPLAPSHCHTSYEMLTTNVFIGSRVEIFPSNSREP